MAGGGREGGQGRQGGAGAETLPVGRSWTEAGGGSQAVNSGRARVCFACRRRGRAAGRTVLAWDVRHPRPVHNRRRQHPPPCLPCLPCSAPALAPALDQGDAAAERPCSHRIDRAEVLELLQPLCARRAGQWLEDPTACTRREGASARPCSQPAACLLPGRPPVGRAACRWRQRGSEGDSYKGGRWPERVVCLGVDRGLGLCGRPGGLFSWPSRQS